MILDFQGLPLEVNETVFFIDAEDIILRKGTVTGIGHTHITVLADVLWTTFRVLPHTAIKVNSLSLPNS